MQVIRPDPTDQSRSVTVLLPWYLHEGFRDLLHAIGFQVLWAEKRELLVRLLRSGSRPDIALEWQHGPADFPVLDLLRCYELDIPVFLVLNWNGRLQGDPTERGYAGWLHTPIQLRPMLRSFAGVLEPERRGLVWKMLEELDAGPE